ncbi:hypothetical protein A152_0012600 [Vibrio tasmaniensis 1F-187]|uniref:hypothetical protein n=1 Tax=unclassified Vibrio TaxID=2614977 RepID=UPI0002E510F4|nr:hypothetical protein [Vibrio tasmaniensis]OEF71858.1 hypothetical protein A152_13610 [Vibrio tasmaniensis 1F-187]
MKVEQHTAQMTPTHDQIVFANEHDAKQRDLSKAIGRFDAPRKSIIFVDDNSIGTKYKALMDNGFQIHLAKDDRNNYYITDLLDNISKAGENLGVHESVDTGETADIESTDNNTDERPELTFKEESEFLEQDIDSAMDLDFTTESLNYEHRVGLYNEDSNMYTLREDVKDLLDEFEFNIDENEDGVIARIAPESIKGRKLLKLVNLLKKQEQDDDAELKEAIESGRVQFDSLATVKQLLRRLALAQKHGDIEESDEAEVELNELINTYKQANPPAAGIEKVEVERDEILTPQVDESAKKQSKPKVSKPAKQSSSPKKSSVGKTVDRELGKHSSTYRKGKKIAKSVSNIAKSITKKETLDEKLKADAEKQRYAESILESCGIQVRGQQHVV